MKPAEKYILGKPEPFRAILLYLQSLIEREITDIGLLYKWNLPFFYLHGKQPFCYLNQTNGYVDLVFWHGTHLTKHTEKLVSGGRKHMKSLRFHELEEIDEKIVIEILREVYSLRGKKYYK